MEPELPNVFSEGASTTLASDPVRVATSERRKPRMRSGSFWNRSISEFNTAEDMTMIWWELQGLDVNSMESDALHQSVTEGTGYSYSFVILPNQPFKLRWDLGIAAILTFSIFSLPFRIAFLEWKKTSDSFNCGKFNTSDACASGGCSWDSSMRCSTDLLWMWLLISDTFVDLIFLIDVSLSFRSAYYVWKKGKRFVVTNPRQISMHYLKTWFTCDLIASLPIEMISIAAGGSTSYGSALTTSKLLRLVNLAKMLRVLKIWRIRDMWSGMISHATSDALGYLFIFVVTAHLMSCFLFWLGTFQDFYCKTITPQCSVNDVLEDKRITWITQSFLMTIDQGEVSVEELRLDHQYLVSLYWAFTIMTTVGYGDLKPRTIYEVWGLIVCMLVGATFFSFIVGMVTNSIERMQGNGFWQKTYEMLSFMHDHRLPQDLRRRINDYLHYSKTIRTKDIRGTLLEELSPMLQQKITINMRKEMMMEIPLFKSFCHEKNFKLLGELAVLLTAEIYSPGDLLFTAGDSVNDLIILETGDIKLVDANSDTHFATFHPGSFLGENGLLGSHPVHLFSALSHSWSIVFRLKLADLERVLEDSPAELQSVRMMSYLRWTRLTQAVEAHETLRRVRAARPGLTTQSLLRVLIKLHDDSSESVNIKLTAEEGELMEQMLTSSLAGDLGKMLSLKLAGATTTDEGEIEWDWSTDWIDSEDLLQLAEWFEQASGSSVLAAKLLAAAIGTKEEDLDLEDMSIAGLDNVAGYRLPGQDLKRALGYLVRKLDVVEAQTRLTLRLDAELKRTQELIQEKQASLKP